MRCQLLSYASEKAKSAPSAGRVKASACFLRLTRNNIRRLFVKCNIILGAHNASLMGRLKTDFELLLTHKSLFPDTSSKFYSCCREIEGLKVPTCLTSSLLSRFGAAEANVDIARL